MRIVIDLQGVQSVGSRGRGIGRYSLSLAQGIARNRGSHEVLVVLNGLFPETVLEVKAAMRPWLASDAFRVWTAQPPVAWAVPGSERCRSAAELIREAFIASLKPDIVLLSSLFEGFSDDAVTTVPVAQGVPTAVVLYDLIPLIHSHIYLSNPLIDSWYRNKLVHLRRADLVLSISASSGDEAVRELGCSRNQVTNISGACDPHFQPMTLGAAERQDLQDRFGISRAYLMYTGGIDHRKNIETLITAFAQLPVEVRLLHQLVLVCSIRQQDRDRLTLLGRQAGLSPDELVMTGYVSDNDLVKLYNGCHLFVFPSWHEGFGLPALEAMQCGRPVLAANTSSLPEVVGLSEALFDPHDPAKIAEKIVQGLTDNAFRQRLIEHGAAQARRFSWDQTAQTAVEAMERAVAGKLPAANHVPPSRRPRLAYVSPLPPGRSGISDYSAELLPALSRWYDIDVVLDQEDVSCPPLPENCVLRDVAWLKREHVGCERVLYHFGNSTFHTHMFDLIESIPGVVVLHDFFLSGIYAHREWQQWAPHVWTEALMSSHGYAAVQRRFTDTDGAAVVHAYPCNLPVLQSALGVIVHNQFACSLADRWYGDGCSKDWDVIPLLREPPRSLHRERAREQLGLPLNAFIVCSFGHVESTKLGHRLVDAFKASEPGQNGQALLIFVGANGGGTYGDALDATIATCQHPDQIRITGWTDADAYHAYLAAADVGVQLRTQSRGETSAAALDCMNYGLATVVNAHGGMAELSPAAVWRLPDDFSDSELTSAINELWRDTGLRSRLGAAAHALLADAHAPAACAQRYMESIERSYKNADDGLQGLLPRLASMTHAPSELVAFAQSAARSFPPRPRLRQCLVLIDSGFRNGPQRLRASHLAAWVGATPAGWVVEPVYVDDVQHCVRYARKWACNTLGVSDAWAHDLSIDAWQQDVLVQRPGDMGLDGEQTQAMHWLAACGVAVMASPSLDGLAADPGDIVKLIQNLAAR